MSKMVKLLFFILLAITSLALFAQKNDINQKLLLKKTHINTLSISSSKVATSRPLKKIAKPIPKLTAQRKRKLKNAGIPIPGEDTVRIIPNQFPFQSKFKSQQIKTDTALQTTLPIPAQTAQSSVVMGVSFDGVGNVLGAVPPDTNGDVGPDHYVQAVNIAMAIYDKQGNELIAPFAINNLWQGFGGICETHNDGDPIVLYDGMADRWMISQFALNGTDNHQCIAISTTGDPTDTYYLYDFPYGELMNDYPHFGVWPDGYYMGVNQFDAANNYAWAGGGVAVYEREKMLVGSPAKQVIFSMRGNTPEVFTPMPLDLDGVLPPPPEQSQLFIWAGLNNSSKLYIWQLDVDWQSPSNSTFSPKDELDVAQWNSPSNATQPNGVPLDNIAIRSMFRAAYRRFSDHGVIAFTHTVAGADGITPAMRWYEIHIDAQSNLTLHQQGTFSPDNQARWMSSGAIDAQGNMAFGYSLSSEDTHPSSFAAYRLVDDSLGYLRDEIELKAGKGSQGIINRYRWGDYSSMSIDPSDDCTFWFTTEYYKAENDSTLSWSTNISSFKLASCTSGPTGVVQGNVNDANSSMALANVKVSFGNITTYTNTQGEYSITLPVGNYELSSSKYGWLNSEPIAINLAEDERQIHNISLNPAQKVIVSGVVNDAGTAEWPLYAKIFANVPGETLTTFTDPVKGTFQLPLFAGTNITLGAETLNNEYISVEKNILPTLNKNNAVSFSLTPNPNCTAKGYAYSSFLEKFEGSFPPLNWQVTDNAGNNVIWTSSANASRGNITNTKGNTAIIDSDAAGTVDIASELISPVFDTQELTSFALNFVANHVSYTGQDSLDLDIKVDSQEWQTIQTLNKGIDNLLDGLASYSIDLTPYLANSNQFQLRWNYYKANYEWYAAIDDVAFGNPKCVFQGGNIVSGYIIDDNFETPLDGVTISANDKSIALSSSTPNDNNLHDGFVHAYITQDIDVLSLAKNNYKTQSIQTSEVTLETPIRLKAGLLTSSKESIAVTLTQGRKLSEEFILNNVGKHNAEFNLSRISGNTILKHTGIFHPSARHFGPKNLGEIDTKKIRHFPNISAPILPKAKSGSTFNLNQSYPWGLAINKFNNTILVNNVPQNKNQNTQLYSYNKNINLIEEVIEAKFVDTFAADMAFNGRTGMFWLTNVEGDNCIHEINPNINNSTGHTICPKLSVSQRGLAYDPITDTFYSGSWNDGVIHQYTASGQLLRSVNVDLSIAGLAFNPASGHLFVTNNAQDNEMLDIYILDTDTPLLSLLGGFDVALKSKNNKPIRLIGHAGLDFDCDGNLWAIDQVQQQLLSFPSGEAGICNWAKNDWLSLQKITGEIEPEQQSPITLDINAITEVGIYNASIIVDSNTPYPSLNIPVELTVTPPNYGVIGFNSPSYTVKNGDSLSIDVTRSGGFDYAVSAQYKVIDGTANKDEHIATLSGELNWEDYDKENKTILIETKDTDIDEALEFKIELADANFAELGDNKTITVTLLPDNVGTIVPIEQNITIDENIGALNITLQRLQGSDREVSIDYTVQAQTASIEDFQSASGSITWFDQDAKNKSISININDDNLEEADELFTIQLTSNDIEVNNNIIKVTISNNDKSPPSAPVANSQDNGGSGGAVTILIYLLSLIALSRRSNTNQIK